MAGLISIRSPSTGQIRCFCEHCVALLKTQHRLGGWMLRDCMYKAREGECQSVNTFEPPDWSRRLTVLEKSMSLLKLVEERALSKKTVEEEKRQLVPYIPKECILNILVRLPLESLQKMMLVCKMWYMIIKSSIFIDAHFQRSESVLIFLKPLTDKDDPFFPYGSSILQEKNTKAFSVESKLFDMQSLPVPNRPVINPSLLSSLTFLEFKNGDCKIAEYNATCMGKIRASCRGLILLENLMKKGGLIIMNPVTRSMSALPVGTIFPSSSESYGLAFSMKTNEFKLVHLFLDSIKYLGCEILTPNAKTWTSVDGPQFIGSFLCNDPVFSAGSLHWALQNVDHCDYIVSMEVDSEKFKQIPLPKSYGVYDKIMEINGNLGYLTEEEGLNRIDVWILQDLLHGHQGWKKQYTITEAWWKDMVPLYCPKFKDEIMIFVMDKSDTLYAYNFQLRTLEKMETMKQGKVPRDPCFVLVNSLFSWKTMGK